MRQQSDEKHCVYRVVARLLAYLDLLTFGWLFFFFEKKGKVKKNERKEVQSRLFFIIFFFKQPHSERRRERRPHRTAPTPMVQTRRRSAASALEPAVAAAAAAADEDEGVAAAATRVPATKHKRTVAAVGGDDGGDDDVGKKINGARLVTHLGFTLDERWIDSDTVEYTVHRTRRDALMSSSTAPLLLSLVSVALVAMAVTMAAGDDDDANIIVTAADASSSSPDGVVEESEGTLRSSSPSSWRWVSAEASLLAAAAIAAWLALRAVASCVVSESLLVMRHLGIQLCTRRLYDGGVSLLVCSLTARLTCVLL